ncbi:MAG: aminotransferase DegT [Elusimicrobia bacterium RIFOXYA1_FULL_47_7]|nr:MAG: aminotransferase DegT [Elusimicrobia bacterium RIFOXYA12_FULL_49_49]OGS09695.1 MAG: aminotransferase DegT [Elusimicrobia bacterium RIFOXYA1_FULL_47_7]OGS16794.1 MAG: aminotransferase DegT [Elusimicrobia bacterium RIFOXYA2_FULL_47_53]OGS32022.1 MAG: aminotransferase DegT [Elusimicrobia bacterium RIFOXYB2_FULL_46_23]
MKSQIFLDAPNVGKLEKQYLYKAITAGFVSTAGPFVGEFEEKFARYISAKKAVSTQSGTAALHVSLYELGIGRGDEVIVPAITFIATVNPIIQLGARPVFADIDSKTWNIDPKEIEKLITKKTKAIVPVHLYGNPCDMGSILKLAKKHKLKVIEDATESLGAAYCGKLTGTFGDLGCYSFNGNKIMTTGGGGMIVGRDAGTLAHLKFLVNQARDESKGYFHPEVGFNYRMTNIEASLGLAQISRLNGFLKLKRDFNKIYRNDLSGISKISFQECYKDAVSSYWLTCMSFENSIDISKLQEALKERGIPTRRLFMPIPWFPPYKNAKRGTIKTAEHIYNHSLCFPGSTKNSLSDIKYICKTLKTILKSL